MLPMLYFVLKPFIMHKTFSDIVCLSNILKAKYHNICKKKLFKYEITNYRTINKVGLLTVLGSVQLYIEEQHDYFLVAAVTR